MAHSARSGRAFGYGRVRGTSSHTGAGRVSGLERRPAGEAAACKLPGELLAPIGELPGGRLGRFLWASGEGTKGGSETWVRRRGHGGRDHRGRRTVLESVRLLASRLRKRAVISAPAHGPRGAGRHASLSLPGSLPGRWRRYRTRTCTGKDEGSKAGGEARDGGLLLDLSLEGEVHAAHLQHRAALPPDRTRAPSSIESMPA